jgi:hypothetical protein
MRTKNLLSLIALSTLITFTNCKKNTTEPVEETPDPVTPSTPSYTVPTSYNFSNADFTSSTRRITMLGEITTYIRSTHTTTQSTQPTLSAQKLKDMYANAGNSFADPNLNSSDIQLKDQTGDAFSFRTTLETSFEDAAAASVVAAVNPTVSTASKGVKGKIISPSRAILVDANGFEYKEFAEKGLMGAVFYYNATTILANIGSYDNTTLVNGSTAQEKAWDEAFGYFGVPVNFPTNTVGLKNWGNYANAVNGAINCNTTIMDAFLKGRAAISNKDNVARDAARTVVLNTWEKVAAAKCVSYLKGAKNNLTDAGTLHHNLSEGYGFVTGFAYNPSKTISDADIALLMGYFGTNLYDITQTNIDNAISKLATVFSLDTSKL